MLAEGGNNAGHPIGEASPATAPVSGGGLYNLGGPVTLVATSAPSSVTGNLVNARLPLPRGGGIYNSNGTVDPTGGTITLNDPDDCVDVGSDMGCPP
jgi:hypothetical protein